MVNEVEVKKKKMNKKKIPYYQIVVSTTDKLYILRLLYLIGVVTGKDIRTTVNTR